MTGAVQIGSNSLRLCGNAATPIRYKQVFHKDLLMSFKAMSADEFDVDTIKQVAFIMALQAESANFNQVTYDDFIDWLCQFEEADVLGAAGDIIGMWMNNSKTSVVSKKK